MLNTRGIERVTWPQREVKYLGKYSPNRSEWKRKKEGKRARKKQIHKITSRLSPLAPQAVKLVSSIEVKEKHIMKVIGDG